MRRRNEPNACMRISFATPQIRAQDIFIEHAHIWPLRLLKTKKNSEIYFNKNKLKIRKTFRTVLNRTQRVSQFQQRKDNG